MPHPRQPAVSGQYHRLGRRIQPLSHSLRFYNAVGGLVKEVDGVTSGDIDIAALPGGLYFIRSASGADVSLKFIKQ